MSSILISVSVLRSWVSWGKWLNLSELPFPHFKNEYRNNLWGLLEREGTYSEWHSVGLSKDSSHCFPQLDSIFPLAVLGYNLHSTKSYQGNLEMQAAKPVGWHQLLSPGGLSYPFWGSLGRDDLWPVQPAGVGAQQIWGHLGLLERSERPLSNLGFFIM